MSAPCVVVVHTEDGPWPAVRGYWDRSPFEVEYALTTKRSPFAYADVLRRIWRYPHRDLVICEQDVVPPSGSPECLLSCGSMWCTHPHFTGQTHCTDTLGLVKFSWRLRQRYAFLADLVASEPDSRYWVRRGWTNLHRALPPAQLNRAGRRATITAHSIEYHRMAPASDWITTHDWIGLDTSLSRQLRSMGIEPCVHRPATLHLHDYSKPEPPDRLPWHQRPYDPEEWPWTD